MKLYKNVSRFRFRRMYSKGSPSERQLKWGLSLKPGDVISACTGFNIRVAKVTPERTSAARFWGARSFGYPFNGRSQGWFISDVLIEDTDGGHHYIMSCCWKPETVEQIETFWKGVRSDYEDGSGRTSLLKRLHEALAEGRPICDEDGIRLSEFKTKWSEL